MKHCSPVATVFLLITAFCSYGQTGGEYEGGFDLGGFHFEPDASASVAHDDRVVYDDAARTAEADVYSDLEAGISLYNHPALFNFTGNASYGYRSYNDLSYLNEDFYSLGAMVQSSTGPWTLEVGSDWTKSLNYNTGYNASTGQQPDSILTGLVNRRISSHGSIAYERFVTERLSIEPAYALIHYKQEFDNGRDAEWLMHVASLQMNFKYSDRFRYYLRSEANYQVADAEDGVVGNLVLGAEGQATAKTTWMAQLGYSVADYEESGRDQGVVSSLRGGWRISDKFDAYVFGGNDFQPGYGDIAARMVYRLGYGAVWRPTDRLSFEGSVLHDYQEEVGGSSSGDPAIGVVRHFTEIRALYRFARYWRLGVEHRYINDEYPVDQQVVLASIEIMY